MLRCATGRSLPGAASFKQQALTTSQVYCRMDLERIVMDNENLKRIADALEEILRLVKADQAKTAERMKKYDKEEN